MATLRHVIGRLLRPSASVFDLRLFPSKRRKASGKNPAREVQIFIIILECSDSDIKKPVANALPENTKKVKKYAVNIFNNNDNFI